MARKVVTLVIDKPGRDVDKVFVLTEFPATQGEKWAARALIALARSNPSIPEDMASLGWQALASMGVEILSGINFTDAEPLLDEMMRCVKFMPDSNKPTILRDLGVGGVEDIEEISTIIRIRKEVFNLHADFFG